VSNEIRTRDPKRRLVRANARGGEIRTLGGQPADEQLVKSQLVTKDFKSLANTGFSSRQQGFSYQQKPVESPNYPRINAYALGQLFTHKRLRFGLKARINTYAFTHKHLRLYASRPRDYWATATPPVYTYIKNLPVLRTIPILATPA